MAKKKLSKKHSKNFIKKKNRSTKRRQRKVIKKGGTVQVLQRDDIESFKIILDAFNNCFIYEKIYDDVGNVKFKDNDMYKGKNNDCFDCIKQEIETKINEKIQDPASKISLERTFLSSGFYYLLFKKYDEYSRDDDFALEQIPKDIENFFNNINVNKIFFYLYLHENKINARNYDSFLKLFTQTKRNLFLYNFLNELIGIINASQVEEPIQQVEITESKKQQKAEAERQQKAEAERKQELAEAERQQEGCNEQIKNLINRLNNSLTTDELKTIYETEFNEIFETYCSNIKSILIEINKIINPIQPPIFNDFDKCVDKDFVILIDKIKDLINNDENINSENLINYNTQDGKIKKITGLNKNIFDELSSNMTYIFYKNYLTNEKETVLAAALLNNDEEAKNYIKNIIKEKHGLKESGCEINDTDYNAIIQIIEDKNNKISSFLEQKKDYILKLSNADDIISKLQEINNKILKKKQQFEGDKQSVNIQKLNDDIKQLFDNTKKQIESSISQNGDYYEIKSNIDRNIKQLLFGDDDDDISIKNISRLIKEYDEKSENKQKIIDITNNKINKNITIQNIINECKQLLMLIKPILEKLDPPSTCSDLIRDLFIYYRDNYNEKNEFYFTNSDFISNSTKEDDHKELYNRENSFIVDLYDSTISTKTDDETQKYIGQFLLYAFLKAALEVCGKTPDQPVKLSTIPTPVPVPVPVPVPTQETETYPNQSTPLDITETFYKYFELLQTSNNVANFKTNLKDIFQSKYTKSDVDFVLKSFDTLFENADIQEPIAILFSNEKKTINAIDINKLKNLLEDEIKTFQYLLEGSKNYNKTITIESLKNLIENVISKKILINESVSLHIAILYEKIFQEISKINDKLLLKTALPIPISQEEEIIIDSLVNNKSLNNEEKKKLPGIQSKIKSEIEEIDSQLQQQELDTFDQELFKRQQELLLKREQYIKLAKQMKKQGIEIDDELEKESEKSELSDLKEKFITSLYEKQNNGENITDRVIEEIAEETAKKEFGDKIPDNWAKNIKPEIISDMKVIAKQWSSAKSVSSEQPDDLQRSSTSEPAYVSSVQPDVSTAVVNGNNSLMQKPKPKEFLSESSQPSSPLPSQDTSLTPSPQTTQQPLQPSSIPQLSQQLERLFEKSSKKIPQLNELDDFYNTAETLLTGDTEPIVFSEDIIEKFEQYKKNENIGRILGSVKEIAVEEKILHDDEISQTKDDNFKVIISKLKGKEDKQKFLRILKSKIIEEGIREIEEKITTDDDPELQSELEDLNAKLESLRQEEAGLQGTEPQLELPTAADLTQFQEWFNKAKKKEEKEEFFKISSQLLLDSDNNTNLIDFGKKLCIRIYEYKYKLYEKTKPEKPKTDIKGLLHLLDIESLLNTDIDSDSDTAKLITYLQTEKDKELGHKFNNIKNILSKKEEKKKEFINDSRLVYTQLFYNFFPKKKYDIIEEITHLLKSKLKELSEQEQKSELGPALEPGSEPASELGEQQIPQKKDKYELLENTKGQKIIKLNKNKTIEKDSIKGSGEEYLLDKISVTNLITPEKIRQSDNYNNLNDAERRTIKLNLLYIFYVYYYHITLIKDITTDNENPLLSLLMQKQNELERDVDNILANIQNPSTSESFKTSHEKLVIVAKQHAIYLMLLKLLFFKDMMEYKDFIVSSLTPEKDLKGVIDSGGEISLNEEYIGIYEEIMNIIKPPNGSKLGDIETFLNSIQHDSIQDKKIKNHILSLIQIVDEIIKSSSSNINQISNDDRSKRADNKLVINNQPESKAVIGTRTRTIPDTETGLGTTPVTGPIPRRLPPLTQKIKTPETQ